MKIFCFFLLAALCSGLPNLDEWESFKSTYGKEYATQAEEDYRRDVFHQNKKAIEEHNKKYEQGLVSYYLKMNHFGDLMQHEVSAILNGYKKPEVEEDLLGSKYTVDDTELPESIDWSQKGAVTEVKYQVLCDTSWAFSATGALEGQHFLKTGELVSLSEQQLIDCSYKYGNRGCWGGSAKNAFKYVADNGGIDSESSYKYTLGLGLWCRYRKSKVAANCTGYVSLPSADEEALKHAVATVGPISAAMDTSKGYFSSYGGGIFDTANCSRTDLDQEVLVVGYGSWGKGLDYWIVKNSYSNYWGMEGYFYLARNKDNMCGIATRPSYPTV